MFILNIDPFIVAMSHYIESLLPMTHYISIIYLHIYNMISCLYIIYLLYKYIYIYIYMFRNIIIHITNVVNMSNTNTTIFSQKYNYKSLCNISLITNTNPLYQIHIQIQNKIKVKQNSNTYTIGRHRGD